jgi:hypothetical protein
MPTMDTMRQAFTKSLTSAAVPGGPSPSGDVFISVMQKYVSDSIGYLLGVPAGGDGS